MEDNIKIFQLDPDTFEYQDYNPTDENLITQSELDTNFSESTDYIEFYIFDENQNLIYPSSTIPLTSYNIKQGDVLLNPSKDLENLGFDIDTYNILYSFYRKRLASNTSSKYFIKEISSDRTELRLDSNIINNNLIISSTNKFIQHREDSPYFVDFLLNFGNNQTIISNNLRLDTVDSEDPTILVKLYEPLPEEFGLKDELWVVEGISTPQLYQVEFPFIPIIEEDFEFLAGPNFSLDVKNVSNNTTQEFSYNTLINSQITSSNSELENLLEEKSIGVNINYEDFSDFIHFSSAKTRLENFIYKVQLIEDINTQTSNLESSLSQPNNPTFINEKQSLNSRKNDILKNLDGYEKFLYFNSGSQYTYPKSSSTYPYTLYSSTSPEVENWLNFITPLIEEYDDNNRDQLKFTIPEYLREDPDNKKYDLFIDMIGQHYDNIWVYTKNISNRFSADNRLNYGISKDLVKEAIEDFGIKLYSNNFDINDLYTSFLGVTPTGDTFPYPNITGSLPTPNGFEYVDTYITSSNTPIPLNDLDRRIQKRIYHNIPYLLKTKGTMGGLRALITSYGVPDTILNVYEPTPAEINLKNNIYPINPSGSNTQDITLSPLRSVQQGEIDDPFIKKYIEVGFSIQDGINEDISSSLGDYNLGEYIGDPREIFSSSKTYPNLDALRDSFYSTYNKTKKVKDFIRIIKFFDNSLFKMIKDFVPANTSLSAGVTVKQHSLERNRQRPAKTSFSNETLETQIKSFPFNYQLKSLVKTQGGTGGSFERYNGLETSNSSSQFNLSNKFGITQSYNETLNSPFGPEVILTFDQYEFYDGEFSGSILEVTDQNLNPGCDPYKKIPDKPISYKPFIYNTEIDNSEVRGTVKKEDFLDVRNKPQTEEIWILSEPNNSFNPNINNQGEEKIYDITYLKISTTTGEGEDITNYFNNSLKIIGLRFNGISFILHVLLIENFRDYVQITIDNSKGNFSFSDYNLVRKNGNEVNNFRDSDLGEKGSKNFKLIAEGDFISNEDDPYISQGSFNSDNVGEEVQFIQFYNGEINDIQNYFNTGSDPTLGGILSISKGSNSAFGACQETQIERTISYSGVLQVGDILNDTGSIESDMYFYKILDATSNARRYINEVIEVDDDLEILDIIDCEDIPPTTITFKADQTGGNYVISPNLSTIFNTYSGTPGGESNFNNDILVLTTGNGYEFTNNNISIPLLDNSNINYSVDENESDSTRIEIIFSTDNWPNEDKNYLLSVNANVEEEELPNDIINFSPNSFTTDFLPDDITTTISIDQSTSTWNDSVPIDNSTNDVANWVNVARNGNDLTISINKNSSISPRSAYIEIQSSGTSGVSEGSIKDFTITQYGDETNTFE